MVKSLRCMVTFCLVAGSTIFVRAQDNDGQRNIAVQHDSNKKWALLIGVDKYISAKQLSFCGRDANALHRRLMELEFDRNQMFLLHDEAMTPRDKPFKSNIDRVIQLLLGKLSNDGKSLAQKGLVSKGDLVVIAFSGHGVHIDGHSYFCPIDADLNKPETLLSLTKLYQLLALSPANVKLMLVDACRNDPRPKELKANTPRPQTKELANSLVQPPRGILVLSSCAPGQVSVEDPALRHGVFMNFLLEGLSGLADLAPEGNKNKRVSLLELYEYASGNTQAYVAQEKRIQQTPTLRGELIVDFEFGELTRPDKSRTLFAFLFCDDDETRIGRACATDRRAMRTALTSNIAADKVKVFNFPIEGLVQVDEIMQRTRFSANDAVFVYASGRGHTNRQGGIVLDIPSANTHVVRSRIMDGLVKQDLPLTVLITDVSAEFAEHDGKSIKGQLSAQASKDIFARLDEPDEPTNEDNTSPALLGLFFQSDGVIDINSCEKHQFCWKSASEGSLFTSAFAKLVAADKSFKDDFQGWHAVLQSASLQAGFGFAKQFPEQRKTALPSGIADDQKTQTLYKIRFDISPTVRY